MSWKTTWTRIGVLGALTLLPCMLWLTGVPISGGADEPSHVLRAASVARGELLGSPATSDPSDPRLVVDVQESVQQLPQPACYVSRPEVPADCDAGSIGNTTSSGRHLPAYYGITGLPFLLASGEPGAYLARAVSAILSAAFLTAAAFLALRSASTLPLVGVLAAVPPMTLHLAGLVNPNAVEATAAVALWVAALVAVRADPPPAAAISIAGTAAIALALTRQLGPVWLVIILVTAAMVARPGALRALARRRLARGYAIAVAAALSMSAAWQLVVGNSLLTGPFPEPPPLSPLEALRLTLFQTPLRLEQMIGQFGWLDTLLPRVVWQAWLLAPVALVALSILARPGWRWLLALGGVILAAVLVPAALEAWRYNQLGITWQGRYTLPLAAGIPILAGFAAAEASRAHGRWREVLMVPLAAVAIGVHGIAFFYALRRFTAGTAAPLYFLDHQAWTPPLPAEFLLVLFGTWMGACGLALLVLTLRRTSQAPPALPAPAEEEPGSQQP